jgi:ketosteroid isomerase-like protein
MPSGVTEGEMMRQTMAPVLVFAVGLLLSGSKPDRSVAPIAEASRGPVNKALVRRYYEQLSKGNLAIIDQICAPNYVLHIPWPSGTPLDRRGTADERESAITYRHWMMDVHYTVEDQVAEGDKVVTRWTLHGTTKAVSGFTAGTKVNVTGIVIDRIVGGQIAERWLQADSLGFRQPLGLPLTGDR